MFSIGVIAALVALVSWGFGDFFIQRTARKIGSMEALFFICLFGAVLLAPFAWTDVRFFLHNFHIMILLLVTVIISFLAAIIDFEAMRRGKLAVIEPVMSSELVFIIAISIIFLGEHINYEQIGLIILVGLGILLVVIRHEPKHWWQWLKKRKAIERGVVLAVAGAVAMALSTVLTGLSSRETNPISSIWFVFTLMAVICLLYFLARREFKNVLHTARANWRVVLAESFFDTISWLAYAVAVRYLPVSIAVAITESYVALAAMLGIIFNGEKFQRHQKIGIVVTLVATIVLAVISGG